MPDVLKRWTREEVLALPDDGNRYELVHGELALYQERGVPDYWIVDLDARLVEHWRPPDQRPAILDQRLEWQPDPMLSPLSIDLPVYFREGWGEDVPSDPEE